MERFAAHLTWFQDHPLTGVYLALTTVGFLLFN